ncbi:calcium-binding protein [Nocardioides sp. J54]|uniref:calcium-binding protein n=1 Tax=Nocardioides sp. J54 TaxID=935866 RepID=UPI0004B11A0C|nr:calcium-binding protein [Nocardioides sp. J54]
MNRRLSLLLAAALLGPVSVGLAEGADAATPRCAGLKATIVGTDAADKINGTSGRDVIVARGGNDVVDGRGGPDVICGSAGNDTIRSGAGAGGLLHGEAGHDLVIAQAPDIGVYGGDGDDVLRTSRSDTLLDGGRGNDRIEGSRFPDVIDGGPGNDHVLANGGADRFVTGGVGNDRIYGGPGTDVLRGGGGDDQITPGPGRGGFAFGEAGNDTIVTGDDGQALYGGPGNDLMKTSWEGTLLDGGPGHDRLHGGAYADVISGGDGNDMISAGGGDDVDLKGGFGTDTCDGGPGTDNCHGGAPGGPGNSPTDPDTCTAEVTRSCRGDELPERWLATLHGHETTRYEVRSWTVKMVLKRAGDPATTTFWREESVTGSFDVKGSDENCAWTHVGSFGGADFTGDLGLVPSADLCWLDVVAGGLGTYSKSCGAGTVTTPDEYFQAWAASNGGPDTLPWDRTKREITGSWHKDGSTTIDVDWVVTPLE